ncbi:MAG: DinB family protein [Pyrinomonadaceae bacterium]
MMANVITRLDLAHNRLLETITPLSEESFTRCPAEDEWSVAQIVRHLCLVEERVIRELALGLQQQPRQLSILRQFVPTSIVASRLVRVKAPKSVVPNNPPEKAATISAYNEARKRLKELYTEHGAKRLKQTIFKHPFLGEISGVATISFVAYHEQRHYKQIREVLRKLNRQG